MSHDPGDEEPPIQIPTFQLDGLLAEMRRIMRAEMEPLHVRLDEVEGAAPRRIPRNRHEEEEGSDPEEQEGGGRNRRPRRDNDMGSIKVKIPSFQGKNDPEAYLEWETKMEMVFDCHNYSEEKKVKWAAIEFTDYAVTWWDQLIVNRRRNRERPVGTWEEMKRLMRKRFVPSHYYRSLYQKLQGMTQGYKSVDEYHKEMEVAMIRANVEEEEEATMARFLHGLNRDIADVVELQHYVELSDMVHQAIKVEAQLKQKSVAKRGTTTGSTTSWKPAQRRDEAQQNKPKFEDAKVTKPAAANTYGNKDASTSKSRDIRCFKCQGRGHISSQCPNKRVMVINSQGDLESEEEEEDEVIPTNEDDSDAESPIIGDLLVTRRALNAQVKPDESNQRENLFHTRCLVNNKVCSVIIDGGSCTNVASNYMVEKLGLTTLKHSRPYRLQWLNDCGDIKVTRQVVVSLSIGKYEDEVLCDVVPMQACHILLGRPWQYDRRVTHDGYTNRYSFTLKKQPITLVPLTPKQVKEDQLHLQNSSEKMREKEKREKDLEREKKREK